MLQEIIRIVPLNILFRVKKHKNGKNVLDWEISVPDWPAGGLYTQPSLKISILHHTNISPFSFFHSKQDMILVLQVL